MPIIGASTPPSPPQQDVPAHQRSIDYANDLGSGFRGHRELKDNAQQIEEGTQHERSQQDVPAEHHDVSPERQRLESPEQHLEDSINQGKYGEGFKVAENNVEQSMKEELEIEM